VGALNGEQRQSLIRAVGGDRDALGKLLGDFGPEIEAALHISAGWRGQIETADVMQITYLEAFLHICRFDPDRSEAFPAWLRRMAENNLRDAIRGLEAKKNPPPRMQLDAHGADTTMALFDVLTAGTGTPSRAARREEVAERLRGALRRLPADYSKAIQLYDLEGKTVEEVAEAMGRSAGAVHMLRMRGHDRLKELLVGSNDFFESRS
jgi:RNA polymerase sigma-70 factor (subfamily 1)